MIIKGFHLRFTVSGGMEGLVLSEVASLLPIASHAWSRRGNSGSQLHSSCDEPIEISLLVSAIRKLRFVEYVYLRVHSQNHTVDGSEDEIKDDYASLLSNVQRKIHATIDMDYLASAKCLARSLPQMLRDCDVGLETLPGELLPTPAIEKLHEKEIDSVAYVAGSSSEFFVNTIYTKPLIARAVVETFVELVNRYTRQVANGTKVGKILWIDAGAGAGALLHHLPTPRLGLDTHPADHQVHQADFFDVTRGWIKQKSLSKDFDTICVISNPPFAVGSRGDFSSIVRFINHASSSSLDATFIGLVVPAKFCRQRIWTSLGMTTTVTLVARFYLPKNTFLEPSTGKSVHIHSCFILFDARKKLGNEVTSNEIIAISPSKSMPSIEEDKKSLNEKDSFYIDAKRNKGDFPCLSTSQLVRAVACGLNEVGVRFRREREAEFHLSVQLSKGIQNEAKLEAWILLNSGRPLSLVNSMSCKVPQHSLGWISISAKPLIASAMLQAALCRAKETPCAKRCALAVNCMSGEGTIELEAQSYSPSSFFLIAGDKDPDAIYKASARLNTFHYESDNERVPLVDFVLWDAQHLPLRRDVVDLFLADLPFAGSSKKLHQEPSIKKEGLCKSASCSLNYRSIFAGAVKVLHPLGVAALLSADMKALKHASRSFHWQETPHGISRINLGGLNGRLMIMEKREPCTKDLSVWVAPGTPDCTTQLMKVAQESLKDTYLDDLLELQARGRHDVPSKNIFAPLVCAAELKDEYHDCRTERSSQCYRFYFDGSLNNSQSKLLEKRIRATIKRTLPTGMIELR